MRGGSANCSVVVSDEPVGSPRVEDADVVVAMNKPSLAVFEKSVVPGGLLIYNSSLIDVKPTRTDIRVAAIPANDIAAELGSAKVTNMVMLGAVAQLTGDFTAEELVDAMRHKFGPLQGAHDAQEPRGHRARHGGCEGLRKCFCPSAKSSK